MMKAPQPEYDDPHAYDYISERRTNCSVRCNLAFRIILVILSAVVVGFTAAGHAINWASYTQSTISPPVKADVRLWKIALSDNLGSGFYESTMITVVRAFAIIGLACGVAAIIMSIVYAAMRTRHENSRADDDEERESVRQEYLRRLQERRRREEVARREGRNNDSFVQNYDVRPPSHPRSYYMRRESKRLMNDFGLGLALWVVLFFEMASMAIVVGCFASFYMDTLKPQTDGKLQLGYWLLCASLACSFVSVVLLLFSPASGWNPCVGRPLGRER